ncbi:MAG: isoleucine--tRNA ligase [Acidimicrobiales bacterium]
MTATENDGASAPYPHVESPDLPAIEARILERWETAATFEQSVEQRSEDNEYVFYDGPPFANGLPHHGHLLTGYVKDVVPRYQTMKGKRVERRFGWDCHGLPAEMEAEKELPVSGRASIIDYGIERFNEYCRTSVLKYTQEWETTVTRQARWVDFENDYKTMDLPYMESVMWAFKQLWDKGLIYQANRVLPYSWGAETPLSNHEIRLDDATRPRQDPAVTVAFTLDDADGIPGEGPAAILAWTTTPWTLPSNLALAVGPDLDYAVMLDANGTRYLIGEAVLGKYDKQMEHAEQIGTVKGSDLVGRTYVPLFPYFADMAEVDPTKPHHGTNRAFVVLAGDFIDTDEGTGVVHMAPGFGEDDQRLCGEAGIGMVVPVDDSGRYTDDVVEWAGENVLEANPSIIKHLRDTGQLIRHDSYTHNYPHCWRTDTPIIYKAMPSWYVKVTDIRDRMLETNQEINWVPGHIKDGRFGMWLEGARDWSISRNRFWGSPIPVWVSDNPEYPRTDVYGSLDELEADFGVRPDNLHRPFIDELTRPNPDDPTGQSTMRRVPEVLDCWFESGSMPFAQVHYPFENKDWFDEHFPADFIVEYINQSRGWFYTMHVLSTAIFDRPGFKNAICHGILLADDGAKLSKKLRNYTEPSEIFEKQGADALRWYFMSTNIVRGGDTRISDQAIDDVVRQVILPIWNAYSFFTLYANVEGYRASFRTDSTELLDRYVLAKTRDLVEQVEARMDAYDLPGAAMEIQSFIDALNNWYIRRSRDRFWGTASGRADRAGLDTLYTVLVTLVQVAAPLLPMITEEIWIGLTGGDAGQPDSVHLTDWPSVDAYPSDPALVSAMDRLRDVASTGLRLREDQGLRVRLPLASVTIAGRDAPTLEPFADLLADELNVKAVHVTEEIGSLATFVLRPDGKALGPRLGKDVQTVFAAAKNGEWESNDDGSVTVAGHTLAEGEYELALESPDDVVAAALRSNDAVVTLDTDVTPALAAEGLARDIVREIQNARKAEDLVVTDRIDVWIEVASTDALAALDTHRAYIAEQVLAESITAGAGDDHLHIHEAKVDNEPLRFTLAVTK